MGGVGLRVVFISGGSTVPKLMISCIQNFRFCAITEMVSPCGFLMTVNPVKEISRLATVDLKGSLNFRYKLTRYNCYMYAITRLNFAALLALVFVPM